MSEQTDSKSDRSLDFYRRVDTTESFIAEAKDIYGDRMVVVLAIFYVVILIIANI